MSRSCIYYLAAPSPYVYLGHQRLVELARQYGVEVDVRPINLAAKVFPVSGGLPLPQRPPQRRAYRLVELQRWSQYRGLPLNVQPRFFPVADDPAARLIIAAKLRHGADAALALTGGVTRAVWAEERDIADADTLLAIANAAGLDGAALLQAAQDPAIQAEYERYTEEAIKAGVFGAPWYIVDGEPFWGQDRLDFVERAFQRG